VFGGKTLITHNLIGQYYFKDKLLLQFNDMSSSERFGYEWDLHHEIIPDYERQFRNWVYPLNETDFRDKDVMDVGCGMGRNSFWPARWEAKSVIAFDLDPRTVQRAGENLKNYKNVQVLQKSAYDMDWNNCLDIVFSIGVIHHLEYPREVIEHMVKALRPGGTILIWVYSYEGNEWIVRFIDPIRKMVTSKLSLPIVYFLSSFVSIPLWIFVKIFRGPSEYLKQLSKFSLCHIHGIVFDQLIPKVAKYWTKENLHDLFSNMGLRQISIEMPPNKMGWTVIGRK